MNFQDDSMLFLRDDRPLVPGDAVAAIITVGDRYLMQQRDLIPGIFFPGHWGFFGGGIEPGECEDEALRRELEEEIGLQLPAGVARRFVSFDFEFGFAGGVSVIRAFYEVELAPGAIEGLQIREGRAMALLTACEALAPERRIAPYDFFALWVHTARHRLVLPER